jgi:CheY-like chemotaxis protein
MLRSVGLEVATAVSVAQARAVLQRSLEAGRPIELMLMDTELGGDDAIGYARELLGGVQSPSLVLLSPRVRSSLTAAATRDLAVPRLFKPVRQAVLVECVEEALLKCTPAPLPVAAAGGARAPAEHAASARVLLVEDNRVNQAVARRMLEHLGHRVTVAENGRIAVQLVRREAFDLILMDCQMPELDGYEATREIRAAEGDGRRLPIVAMTAHAMVGDREQCLAAGMDDYLTKPVKMQELGETIARWTSARGTR